MHTNSTEGCPQRLDPHDIGVYMAGNESRTRPHLQQSLRWHHFQGKILADQRASRHAQDDACLEKNDSCCREVQQPADSKMHMKARVTMCTLLTMLPMLYNIVLQSNKRAAGLPAYPASCCTASADNTFMCAASAHLWCAHAGSCPRHADEARHGSRHQQPLGPVLAPPNTTAPHRYIVCIMHGHVAPVPQPEAQGKGQLGAVAAG